MEREIGHGKENNGFLSSKERPQILMRLLSHHLTLPYNVSVWPSWVADLASQGSDTLVSGRLSRLVFVLGDVIWVKWREWQSWMRKERRMWVRKRAEVSGWPFNSQNTQLTESGVLRSGVGRKSEDSMVRHMNERVKMLDCLVSYCLKAMYS